MAVDIARVAFASREYRSVKVEDLTVQTRHPLASELTFSSFINDAPANATAFGNYILGLLKPDRYNWRATAKRENYPNLTLGDTIKITHPRFGLSGGKNFIVKRIKDDAASQFLELYLFGPE